MGTSDRDPDQAAPDPLAGRRILVGISGSIAAVKLPQVVSALVQRGAQVRCVLTPSAAQLVSAPALASLSRAAVALDGDQWNHRESRPLHIELAEWAELVLLAPLSATSLARWVHGLGDSLLASVLLATEAPVLAAAAMNTAMWQSPGVARNWQALQTFERVLPLGPSTGLLACDRQGAGRMAEPATLLLALESLDLGAGAAIGPASTCLSPLAPPGNGSIQPAVLLTPARGAWACCSPRLPGCGAPRWIWSMGPWPWNPPGSRASAAIRSALEPSCSSA